jgi:uncharacterized protein (TIGR00369 family)
VSAAAQPRTRAFSWEDPAAAEVSALRMSGLEYLQAIIDGQLPPPPFARALEAELLEVEPGRALFAAEPAEWMYNPLGSVHGGIVATLLDSCMGCAVHSTLETGVGFTTSDLQVRYIRPLTVQSGRVLADGRVVHRGRTTATAEGRVFAADGGALIAHATTGCVILR